MSAASDNALSASQARQGLLGLGGFIQGLREWQVQKPLLQAQAAQMSAQPGLVQAQTDVAKANAAALKQQTDQQKQLFEAWGLKAAQARANALSGLGFGSGDGSGPSLFTPGDKSVSPFGPPVTEPGAPSAGFGGAPNFLDVSRGLPPTISAPGSTKPFQLAGRSGIATTLNPAGEIEFGPGSLSPELKSQIDNDPATTWSQADPMTRKAIEGYLKSNAAALGNRESAAKLVDAKRSASYGNTTEQKEHRDFALNASLLSHRLNQYDDVVAKHGNWNNTLGTRDPEATAKLSSLPMDISENWNKVSNPGATLREGLVHLGKENQIPAGFWTLSNTTRAGIKQTKSVLAEYVRAYENLAATRAPIEGLSADVRKAVGPTEASKRFEQQFGVPVPTDEGAYQPEPAAAKPAPKGAGDSTQPGTSGTAGPEAAVEVKTQQQYESLAPGTWYKDSTGAVKQKSGARPTVNTGSTAGAPKGPSLPALTLSPVLKPR
jgi:hypothetical protein